MLVRFLNFLVILTPFLFGLALPIMEEWIRKRRVWVAILGIVFSCLTWWQLSTQDETAAKDRQRANIEQQNLRDQYDGLSVQYSTLRGQYGEMKGKLDTITQFVEHPPNNLTREQVAAMVRQISLPPTSSVDSFKQQAFGLAEEMTSFISSRERDQPAPGAIPFRPGDTQRESIRRSEDNEHLIFAYRGQTVISFKENYAQRCIQIADEFKLRGLDSSSLRERCQNIQDTPDIRGISMDISELAKKL